MHIEGKSNYHNIFEPTLLKIVDSHGHTHIFQPPQTLDRWFSKVIWDIPDAHQIQHYKLTTDDSIDPDTGKPTPSDERIAFHYLVHPGMKAVIIPPGAFDIMPSKHLKKWISEEIQRFFELLANKHGYRLITGITPKTVQASNQRVVNILSSLWYYMWPPTDEHGIYYGIHQSTYHWDGIPEIWTEPEYMMPPSTTLH